MRAHNDRDSKGYFADTTDLEVAAGNDIYVKFPFLKKPFELLRALPPSPKILDVGCGRGQALFRCRGLRPDAKLYGVDVYQCLQFIDQKDCSFFQVELDKGALPFPDGYFDMVICEHVLEHLYNYSALVREFYRILAPGGVAYIETPDVRMTWLPQAPFVKRGGFNFYDDPTHVRPFTQSTLRLLAERAGFKQARTFQVVNWLWFLAGPYLLWRYCVTRDASHLHSFINPYLGQVVGCYLKK